MVRDFDCVMETNFDIAVSHKGETIQLPAVFLSQAYSYQIRVAVFQQSVTFEPDEERRFRAIVPLDDRHAQDKIDKTLLMEIATELENLFRKDD